MHHAEQKRRSGIAIMASLIGLVKPLLHIMALAVFLGTVGYLCAIFITILASQVLLIGIGQQPFLALPAQKIMALMVVIAVARGFLHYAEQYCNHFIAFRLLAIIRHKVFAALRRLCPAKLDGKDKGNLISVITTDIELLEVFYAHTISPIAIALCVSLIMTVFISRYSPAAGLLALAAYAAVGILIPLWIGRSGGDTGMEYRNAFGELNAFVLDCLRGVDETIQYGTGEGTKQQINRRSLQLGTLQGRLSALEKRQRSVTNLAIYAFSMAMLLLTVLQYRSGAMELNGVITCTIAMMGSFGPVAALSSLSNNLNQTLASGERVLSILEEKPQVEEIEADADASFETNEIPAELKNVTFAYDDAQILTDYSALFRPGTITGIHGVSGSGKSTVLKLLMRFWDVPQGEVLLGGRNVKTIPTKMLRGAQSFVTQETQLFHDSIANNIAVGRQDASREEIVEAAKKASIHDFIMTLPKGYDTEVSELGGNLSGGERQRIGIARAFLNDAPVMLLDEPTSNLDSLNEGIILKSLRESASRKTVVLVSHRESTMKIADEVVEM